MDKKELPKLVTWFTNVGHYIGPCHTCGTPVHYHIKGQKTVSGKTYKPIEHVTCRHCGHAYYGAIYHDTRRDYYGADKVTPESIE